ncbi:MAG: hypothetical protein R2792_18435 [Saprospiraceae bacterium]
MARLTTFSRLLIVALILGGVYFGVTTFLPQFTGKNSDTPAGSVETNSESSENNAKVQNSDKSTWSRQPFTFTAPAPINGKLKGVVELGATGFNSFIIRVDSRKNWKLERAEFGASLVYENIATDEDIKAGLKTYIADMIAYGVGPKDIHFVVSSGAKKVDVTQKIIGVLRSMKYYVNTVTAEQEAQLALKAAMPRDFYNKSFVVDIGSGNTKVSWMSNGSPRGVETYGAKYYQNNLDDKTVYSEVKKKALAVPSGARDVCFIIGGVPFTLAKQIREGDERYTVLKAPSDYDGDGAKQVAGLNIYQAIADATGCKHFVFDWDANFTIGFLLDL